MGRLDQLAIVDGFSRSLVTSKLTLGLIDFSHWWASLVYPVDEPPVCRRPEPMGHGFGIVEHATRPGSRIAILQCIPAILRSWSRPSLGRSGRCFHQPNAAKVRRDLRHAWRHRSVVGRHLRTTFTGQHGRSGLWLHHRRNVQKLALRRPILVREQRLA